MARIARRTLEQFISGLSPTVDTLSILVGEQRAPAKRGDLLLSDFRETIDGVAGGLDVAKVVDNLGARLGGYGYPEVHPSYQLRAMAGAKQVDSFQDTETSTRGGPGGSESGELVGGILGMAKVLQGVCADLAGALKEERSNVGAALAMVSEREGELNDTKAALAIQEQATLAAEEGAKLQLQLRAVDSLESAMGAFARGQGGISAAAIATLIEKQPVNAKKMLGELVKLPGVRMFFIEAIQAAT